MTVCFYLREADEPTHRELPLPDGTTLRAWRPCEQESLPLSPFDPLHLGVWVQHKCGLFDDPRYTELSLWRGTDRIHRLIVTPRWHRFPFMASSDLQIGALWTHPAWRRLGIAACMMDHAHGLFAAPGQRFWYIAESANSASKALAAAAGYRFVGEGQRTRPLGLAMLGRFELEHPAGNLTSA